MMSNTNIPSPWKNSETAGPTQDCLFPAALEALEHLGDSLERIITPGSTDYAGRSKALPYEKALPYVRKAYTNLIGAKSRQEALRAMQHLSSYLDGICDGWYQRIVTLINAVNIDDTNALASQSKGKTMTTIKTQIQALARLQSIATTFYVYHKVKGDRAGGPDYDLLADFTDKAKADKYAADYNKGSKDKFHSAVVRTTKIKEESSARTKVQSDVDQKEAATIVQQVFADNGIKVKVTTFEENSLRVGYMDPVSKELEQFTFNLEGKKIVFDTLGGPVFSGGEIADQLLRSSPDFKGITKGSDVKAFQRWASSVDKDCAKITQQLDEYNIWVNKFVDAIARLQELVALNKFFKRNAKAK